MLYVIRLNGKHWLAQLETFPENKRPIGDLPPMTWSAAPEHSLLKNLQQATLNTNGIFHHSKLYGAPKYLL